MWKSAEEKRKEFHKELTSLLGKFDADLHLEDFGRDWSSNEKIVVTFNWDADLANRNNTGFIPDLIIGSFLNKDCEI